MNRSRIKVLDTLIRLIRGNIGLAALMWCIQSAQAEGFSDSQGVDELWRYQLRTRQQPPTNITLLEKDVLSYYLFDYTDHPKLEQGVTVEYAFKYAKNVPFIEFEYNKSRVNLTHFNIYGERIVKNNPVYFNYIIVATFRKGNKTKKSSAICGIGITVIDKYKSSRFNFRHFEEGFVYKMRSNDSDMEFPMYQKDILGNDLDVDIKEVNTTIEDSNNNSKSQNLIQVKVSPRLQDSKTPILFIFLLL